MPKNFGAVGQDWDDAHTDLQNENYPPATDADGHNNGLVLGPGSSFPERLATASAQYLVRGAKFDNNNFGPRLC